MTALLEVVCDSVSDARAAWSAGAGRIELGCAPTLGGLTPSVGLLEAVRAVCPLPVVVLVRPRPGGFHYDADTVGAMARDAAALVAAGADGIVFGCLTASGTVDRDACARLVDAASGRGCVFHRAFDVVADRDAALDLLGELGVSRILTSGGAATAVEGAPELRRLRERGVGRIAILPAGGIRASNVAAVLAATGCVEAHLGPRRVVRDPTSARGAVDYGEHTALDGDALSAALAALGG